MTVKIVESIPQNADGFTWYTFEEDQNSIGFLYACVAIQKGFDGSTLRVREIVINNSDEDPTATIAKVFSAIFHWNNADNIKFYIDSSPTLFLFALFGSYLEQDGLITSMEKHSNWVVFRGVA